MENRAGQFQLLTKGKGIAQIAIVGDCQLSFEVVDLNRLAVTQVIAAGSAVTDVTNSDLTMRKCRNFPKARLLSAMFAMAPPVAIT